MSTRLEAECAERTCRRVPIGSNTPLTEAVFVAGEQPMSAGTTRRALMAHHCRPLEAVRFGIVGARAAPITIPLEIRLEACDWGDELHQALLRHAPEIWLSEQVGFPPLFLVLGGQAAAFLLSGYASACDGDHVLFSYRSLPPEAVLLDHGVWHSVLAAVGCEAGRHGLVRVDEAIRRALFGAKMPARAWHDRARAQPGSVQAVVPSLDLRSADRVTCHSARVRAQVIDLGFQPERVHVWHPRWRQSESRPGSKVEA